MSFSPLDSGPLYAETLAYTGPSPIIEPWNLASNLLFLGLVIFWWRKRRENHLPSFLRWGLALLFTGWVGGSLYHGLRNSEVWYWMDFLPIYALTFLISSWFWHRIWHWSLSLLVFIPLFTPSLVQLIYQNPSPLLTTLGYAGLMLALIAPIAIDAQVHRFIHFIWILLLLVAFGTALFFRQFDIELSRWLPQGTHFLWHVFGALSVHLLMIYISKLEKSRSTGIHGASVRS